MRPGVALVILVVAGLLTAPVAGHDPQPPNPLDSPNDVVVTYVLRLDSDPTTVEVVVNAEVPSTVEALAIEPPPGADVERAQGFEAAGELYVADGDTPTARLAYRLPLHTPRLRLNASAAPPWAILERRALRERVIVDPAMGRDPDVFEEVRTGGLTPRFPGSSVTLVGDYRVVDSSKPGEHLFRVIVPEGASMAAEPDAVLASLAYARRNFDGGHRHDDVTGFVFEGGERPAGFTPRGVPEFVVRGDARPGGADNAWIHQYVHTRQNFTTTSDLEWLYEGSAAYEAALLSLQQGTASWADFRAAATTDRYADVDLSDPDGDRFRAAAAEKGAAVVAELDERIRRATDGEGSFDEVLWRMNRRDRAIDTAEFERIVADVAGEPGSGEVGAMVPETFDPDPPADPVLFADRPDADPDGDGLSTSRERSAGTNPFVVSTDGDGAVEGTDIDRDTDPTETGAASTAAATPSPSETAATDPRRPTATPASSDDAVSPVQVGAFVAWLALLGASVWVVRRR